MTVIPDHLKDYWDEAKGSVKEKTPDAAIEALAGQIKLKRDAEKRISEEGAIVMDAKGNAVEHPGIKIAREAGREVQGWINRYGST